MTKTTEAVELQSLARGFHSLVGSLKPETVDEAAQEILRAMNLAITKHTLPEAEVGELAESLSSVAGKLKPETADHGAAVILAAMEMKDTPNIMGQFSGTEGEHGSDQIALGSSLAKSLVSFSTVISTEGAERVSRRIFTDIETRTKDPQLDYFAEAFEPVVNKLTPQGARALFLDMLAATSKSTEMNGLSYLAESLGKLGTKLTSDLTEKAELVILETMRKRTENYRSSRKGDRLRIESDEETAERLSALTDAENDKRLYFKQMKGLACSLELVARTLDKHVPGRGAELILTAIEKTADHYMLVYLGHSFAALVAELDSNLADRGSERILGAMGKAAEDHDLHDPIEGLAEGLASLREKLKQETAQRAEDLIMAAMEQAPDKEKLESLVRALGSFGDRVPQTYAEKGLQKLLDYIRNDTAPDCSAAAPLVRKDTVHIIIELLKWPNCSSEQRDLLITKIGEVNGRSFVEGIEGRLTRPKLSAFTNWAEQQGYDIARPPAKY